MEMTNEPLSLGFLHEWALNAERPLSSDEQALLQMVQDHLRQADRYSICLGGKAGRLGECVVGTGLLEATLQAIKAIGKTGSPVQIIVDQGCAELFDEHLYQERYWPAISVVPSREAGQIQAWCQQESERGGRAVLLDFHGANDGMPYFQQQEYVATDSELPARVTILGQCFRVGIRSYAARGPERRYADMCCALFGLAASVLDSYHAQPRLLLPADEQTRFTQLAEMIGLDVNALPVICFFQSVVIAKCYERWDEVLQLLCTRLAEDMPGQRLDLILVCGPDEELPQGIRRADLDEWLGAFRGVEENARVLLCSTPSLCDLAILTSHAILALSNDTGPGHIAGALGIPTVIPFLPGNIYAQNIWSSTLYHHGVTLSPNPYSFRTLEAAILWGKTDIINAIDPQKLCDMAWTYLIRTR